jgi:hypothetical protein
MELVCAVVVSVKLTAQFRGYDKLSLRVKYLQRAAAWGLKAGVGEAGLLMETSAKGYVPVLTGKLRDSIHTESVEDTEEVQRVKVTPITEADNKYGFEPAYPRRIELGFFGPDSLGRVYHQAPQPYMRPAFDENQVEARVRIKDSILMELQAATNTAAGASNRRKAA